MSEVADIVEIIKSPVYVGNCGDTCVKAMSLMKSIGDVSAVKRWLKRPEVIAQEQVSLDSAAVISECRKWLVAAVSYENEHGQGTLIDREHIFWIETIEPTRRLVKQM